jgi:hypothetical protein
MGHVGQTEAGKAERISTWQYVQQTKVTLNHPVGEVWRVLKDMRRWYTEYTLEVISGPPYRAGLGLMEGQILKVTSNGVLRRELALEPDSESTNGPEWLTAKIVKVVPRKEIVTVLTGRAFDWKRYTVFYVWRTTEVGKKATVHVDSYGDVDLIKPLSKAEFATYYKRFTKEWKHSWSGAFANLRKALNSNK